MYDGVPTTELDNLAAETAASLTVKHPDYASCFEDRGEQPAQEHHQKLFPNHAEVCMII